MATAGHELSTDQWSRVMDMASPLYLGDYRTYHNWYHIVDVLNKGLDILASRASPQKMTAVQVISICFHDAIYIPSCPDNEMLSALLMRRLMERPENRDLLRGDNDIDRVDQAIMATKCHFSDAQFSPEINLVLDADLCALAKVDYVDFLNTQTLVHKEFGHFPLEKRVSGQKAILSQLLSRPTIYRSDPNEYPLIAQWEHRARHNLERYCTK